jgi:hypothetical protein
VEDFRVDNHLGFLLCLLGLALSPLAAAEHPQAQITNGIVRAKLYLPDAADGFYRGTRFDWSGVISSLECNGHSYFGQWFSKYDPTIPDVEYDAATKGYAAGPNSASLGPVEEFTGVDRVPLGYAAAAPGGTFLKIGVGVLRKPQEERYSQYNKYEIVDSGKWTVHAGGDRVEFVQEVSHADYGYVYRKTVRLAEGKPEMAIEHELKNTGRLPIETSVYNHNFFVIDKQPSGPDFSISFPFELRATRAMEGYEVRGNRIQYLKSLQNEDRASTGIEGFGDTAGDYDIRVENTKTGAGVRVRGDQPLARVFFWTIASVLSPEAFNHIRINPGEASQWNLTYEFYSLRGAGRP